MKQKQDGSLKKAIEYKDVKKAYTLLMKTKKDYIYFS